MAYNLLLVGDLKRCAELLKKNASDQDMAVEVVSTGMQAMSAAQKGPDLVMVCADLPDVDGIAWLKTLRQTDFGRELPVIVAADRRTDEMVANAFDWGADDYILKGCQIPELLARIRAVLRRRFERAEPSGYAVARGPIALDPSRHECRVRKKIIALRPREFELLEILMRKAGRVLSRRYLLETVWGMNRQADTRAVDIGVSRLRQALGPNGSPWIETIPRFGYRCRAE